eukprot:6195653-Pleurochrysis_carterae.AAC.1
MHLDLHGCAGNVHAVAPAPAALQALAAAETSTRHVEKQAHMMMMAGATIQYKVRAQHCTATASFSII